MEASVSQLDFHPQNQPIVELWPPQVDIILSAMAMRAAVDVDQRTPARMDYRVRAMLRLFADGTVAEPRVLFTRDADPRGLGFITTHLLPLGYGGSIELLCPTGELRKIACTIHRCRQISPGWYEGALHFNREQSSFMVNGTAAD
jgi:hypothetical protein